MTTAALTNCRRGTKPSCVQDACLSAFGPLLSLNVRFRRASEQRDRRCPAGTHAVAVCAARRLHCGPCACKRKGVRQAHDSPQGLSCVRGALHRPGVASQNSLRSLRSLRSNIRDESVYEARCARRPQACASRRHTNRPRRAPPAAQGDVGFSLRTTPACQQRRAGGAAHSSHSRAATGGKQSLETRRSVLPRGSGEALCCG